MPWSSPSPTAGYKMSCMPLKPMRAALRATTDPMDRMMKLGRLNCAAKIRKEGVSNPNNNNDSNTVRVRRPA